MTPEQTIERVARAIDSVLFEQPPDADGINFLARAALSSLRPGDVLPEGMVVEQGWQTIETAPRDGTLIMLWCDYRDRERAEIARYAPEKFPGDYRPHGEFVWQSVGGTIAERIPTHWRPLPAPPASLSPKQKEEGE